MRSASFSPGRNQALGLTVLITWGLGILAVLFYLGRECPVAGVALTPGEARGWTLRYALSARNPDGERLAEHLAARGRVPNLGMEVEIDGPTEWTQRLAAAGWTAHEAAAAAIPRPPRLEILDRDGRVVWSGALPATELGVPGAQILDEALVARVVRGQSTPPIVPVGCAPRA